MTIFNDQLYQRFASHVGHDVSFARRSDKEGGILRCDKCDESPLYEFGDSIPEFRWDQLDNGGLRLKKYVGENVALVSGHEVLLDVEPREYHPENLTDESVNLPDGAGPAKPDNN